MKINVIDLNFFKPKTIACFIIETTDGPVLVESGPESTFTNLEKSLKNFGYSSADVKHVFVTHIHLDHAGAAWRFAKTGATIYVHPNGAKHLVHPEKLLSSAQRIYGDKMEYLWGRLENIPEAQVRSVRDDETLKVGDMEITAVATPGHASHHNAYVVDGEAFTGDIGGVRIGNGPALPPTPPPDINVETWQKSIQKLRSLNLRALYATHFGKFTDVENHLNELERFLLKFTEWIGTQLKTGKNEKEMVPGFEEVVVKILQDANVSPEILEDYKLSNPVEMNVLGMVRYWHKFHEPAA